MSIKLIAELSMNHLGDPELIRKMVFAAHESGADYAKFQTWEVNHLAPGPWDKDGRREDYIKSEMTEEKHLLVKNICNEIGIGFLTSCFNPNNLDMIRRYTNVVKIPSTECNNSCLVNRASELFEKVYVSTGASFRHEFEDYGKLSNIFLLHCVSVYPCPYDCANLSRIDMLRQITPRIGYSGHCEGTWDAIAAIAMGAMVVEKHFTIDRSLPFKDNKISILPEEFAKIDDFRKFFAQMIINKGVEMQELEKDTRNLYSRRWNAN